MLKLLQTIASICLFKAGPQDIAARLSYFFIVLLSAMLLAWLGPSIYTEQPNNLQKPLTYLLSYSTMLWVLLLLFNKSSRWLQCVTALLGCMSVVNALVYILSYVLSIEVHNIKLSDLPLFIVFANFWFFILTTYILKETLEVKWLLAVIIAFSCEIAISIILVNL